MKETSQDSFKTGEVVFGRYELMKLRLSDVNGEVWTAIDNSLGEDVDIRFPRGSGDNIGALTESVERVSELSHPGLLRVFRSEFQGGKVGIVLEPFEGESLAAIRSRRPRKHYEFTELKPWLSQIIAALSYLHETGNVHGAINSINVLVSRNVKLAGLATSVLWQRTGGMPGSIPTLSPQLLDGGQPLPADDIYALGALLYDLLTGMPVFNAGDVALQIAEVNPDPVGQRIEELELDSRPVPDSWQTWIAAALSKERVDRPPLDQLAECLYDELPPAGLENQSAGSVADQPVMGAAGVATVKARGAAQWLPENRKLMAIMLGVVVILAFWFLNSGSGKREAFEKLNQEYAAIESAQSSLSGVPNEMVARWDRFLTAASTSEYRSEEQWVAKLESARAQKAAWQKHAQLASEREERNQAEKALKELRATQTAMGQAFAELEEKEERATPEDTAEMDAAWGEFLTRYADFQNPDSRDDDVWMVKAEEKKKTWAGKITRAKAQADEWSKLLLSQADGLIAAADDTSVSAAAGFQNAQAMLEELGERPAADQLSPAAIAKYKLLEDSRDRAKRRAEEEAAIEPLGIDTIFAGSELADLSASNRREALKSIQRKLVQLDHFNGTPEGKPGEANHAAIISFQRKENLIANGRIDDAFIEKLQPEWEFTDAQDLNEVFQGTEYAEHSLNGRKRHFKALQEKLIADGLYSGAADMAPGPGTHAGIKKLQVREGLMPTGQLSEVLLAKLEMVGRTDNSDPIQGVKPPGNLGSGSGVRWKPPSRRPAESIYCGTRGKLRLARDKAARKVNQAELRKHKAVQAWDARH